MLTPSRGNEQPAFDEYDLPRLGSWNKNGHIVYGHFDGDGRLVQTTFSFIESLTGEVADSTRGEYAKHLTSVLRTIVEIFLYRGLCLDQVLRAFTTADVKEYINHVREVHGLSNATINLYENTLKLLLDWMCKVEGGNLRLTEDSPWRRNKVFTSKENKWLPKCLTEGELLNLMNALHNENERCCIHAAYDGGFRVSELGKLKNENLPRESDFDPKTGCLKMRFEGVKGPKGALPERQTIMSLAVLARIRRYHNENAAYRQTYPNPHDGENLVFLNVHGRPLSTRNLNSQLKAAAVRAKIDVEKIHTHVFRHSFAGNVLQDTNLNKFYGARRILVMTCLGHASLKAGDAYTRIWPEMLSRTDFSKVAQAELIYEKTRLPRLKHKEKRGHS